MATRAGIDPKMLDGTRMSEEEYLALPETMQRMELVDGLVVCDSPDYSHQACIRAVLRRLEDCADRTSPPPSIGLAPLDVRFAPGRILQPDLCVFLEPLARPVRMPLARIPDLCVEIVSTRHAYDRITKRQMYAEAGVRELWTVVRKSRLVERWTGPDLEIREDCRDRLASPLLPGFDADVPSLFAD